MKALTGQRAIVTGASRGIGLAVAQALAREGVRLGFLSRTRPRVTGEFVACDLADSERIAPAVRQLLQRLGPVDILINNAGTFFEKAAAETGLADWDRVQRVNLAAPFLIAREVLPGMIARRRGRIINIASTAALQGYPGQSAYCASKHGLLGFARCLAMEVKPHNIHVHTLCPGGVATGLIHGTQLGRRLEGQPMIQPRDIAGMVVFLLRQPGNVDLPELAMRRFDPAPQIRA
jgi:NAD(P)-dependent dehydrogenase (short-subunit alcohol dehydrogenase family)